MTRRSLTAWVALTAMACALLTPALSLATERPGLAQAGSLSKSVSKSAPGELNYQGHLVDAQTSEDVTATLEITFQIYDQETKGTQLWSETHPVVEVYKGLFSVMLGSMTPFPNDLFDGSSLWLQTEVGAEVLQPRKPMVSVAYSLRSHKADQATEAEHAVLADTAAFSYSVDGWTVDGNDVYRETGKVGIGTTDPSYTVDVIGSVKANMFFGSGAGLTGITTTPDDDWTVLGNNMYAGVSGNVGIGVTNPTYTLHVDGTMHANTYYGDGSQLTGITRSTDDDWTLSGDNIYVGVPGNVGIGTASPTHKLDVSGAVNAATFYGDGSHLTGVTGTGDDDWVIDGDNIYRVPGEIGIGTATPGAKLHIEGGSSENALMAKGGWSYPIMAEYGGSGSDAAICATNTGANGDALHAFADGTGRSAIYARAAAGADHAIMAEANGATWAGHFAGDMHASGKVGIGTETPAAKLDVRGSGVENTIMAKGSWSYPIVAEWGGSGDYAALQARNTGSSGDAIQAIVEGGGRSAIYAQASPTANYAIWAEANGAAWAGYLSGDMHASGQVGIGTISLGSHQLTVTSSGSGQSGATVFAENDATDGIAMALENTSTDATLLLTQNGTGDMMRCEQPASKGVKGETIFKIQNDGRIVGSVLELTGGSDLAEPFNVTSAAEVVPGMLVCIDPQNPGELVLSSRPYDRTVAGIISGAGQINPGMVMGQTGTVADGQHPVALTGRAYCWAEASNGSIQPGDLLTSSQVPGYAMKVTDHSLAQGAIIGKAMSSLDNGQGLVLVLVTLQ